MICIWDKKTPQDKLENKSLCGERILRPTSAYVIEELNGNYSYELTLPILPDDDTWKFIKPYNIIKSSQGQLFPIYKIEYDWSGSYPVVKAWARHIWYYFADKLVFDCRIDMFSCYWAIEEVMKHIDYGRGDGLVDYTFDYSWGSDIDDVKFLEFNEVTAANAFLGNAESIVNKYKGQLHRDNFRFSIKKFKENARENAFNLFHNYNCTGIKHTIDYSNTMTEMYVSDNCGHEMKSSFVPETGDFPHQVTYSKKLSYDKERKKNEEVTFNEFYYDAEDLFFQFASPDSTYEVNFVDMKHTTKYEGWGELQYMVVGSTGYITDAVETSKQHIIYTKYNDITGRMENIKLGSFKPSDLHRTRWDKMLSGDTAAYRRLDLIESRVIGSDSIKVELIN